MRATHLLLLVLLLSPGCVTTERVRRSMGQGEVRCYGGSYDRIWDAALRSVSRNGLLLEDSTRADRRILARSNPGPEPEDPEQMAVDSDAGERVGIFIDSVAPEVWSVEVVRRRIFALDPTPKNWTSDVFETLQTFLPDSAIIWHWEYERCLPPRSATL